MSAQGLDKSVRDEWNDSELTAAVDAYLFLLRLERLGLNFSERTASDILLDGPLRSRNEASIRYRMRNISAVLTGLGGRPLKIYSPADQVGRNVRIRIERILRDHQYFSVVRGRTTSRSTIRPPAPPREDALQRLSDLRTYLLDLERQLLGVGHNNPPGPLTPDAPAREDFERAQIEIDELERELRQPVADGAMAERRVQKLLRFGLKLALWAGQRATKFTDVALTVLAPIVVAKVTGAMPMIVDAMSAVMRAIG